MAKTHMWLPSSEEPKKLKIKNPDYSEFTEEKWVQSIMNWIDFIKEDSQKIWFSKKISGHKKQLVYAEQLLNLVLNNQHQNIVNKIEQTDEGFLNGKFVNSVLLPLGKQAKGQVEQQIHGDLLNNPVQFSKNDFQTCTIL